MITLAGVHKSFGGQEVLRGVDLHVGKGRSMVVMGASGAGKSVMLKSVVGLLEPDTGTITINNTAMTPKSRPRQMPRYGMLFQGAALFDSLPIWQNVAFALLRHLPRAKAREIALQKLAHVGLAADTADRYPAELSGGMQKRAGLARAIAADPEILFFDEPTTGLDPIMAGKINRLIRQIVTDLGVTALTITHDMTTVQTVADDVALLHAGHTSWSGEVSAVETADAPYLHAFMAGRDPEE